MHPNHVSISSLKQQSKNKGKEHKLEHEYEARARTEHDGMGRAPPDQELVWMSSSFRARDWDAKEKGNYLLNNGERKVEVKCNNDVG